jgi:predicted aspartyl protease
MKQTYVLADGSEVPSQQFRIRSIRVGNRTVKDVIGSIAPVKGDILLGQGFLSKFKSWSVDNEQHALILR